MKGNRYLVLLVVICLTLLTGCWDEKLLKDTRFILAMGLDKGSDGKISGIYSTPNANNYPNSTILTTVQGHTVRKLTLDVAEKVSENLDSTRLEMIFFGEKLAKEDGIYPYLDISLRDPNNPLNPFLVITKGNVNDYFLNPIPNEKMISEYYQDLIKSAHKRLIFTEVKVLQGSSLFKNEGNDVVVPYISQSEDKTPRVAGLALFDDGTFTGEVLNEKESILFNIMNNQSATHRPSITQKITSQHEPNIENYVSVDITKAKRDIQMHVQNGKVNGVMTVKLTVEIIESPFYKKGENNDFIREQLEKKLTKKGNEIIQKLQSSNCDGLAIGRQLMAYHNDSFKTLNWKEVGYKEADLKVIFEVSIDEHGILT